jgi:alkylhydroperoxidase family enzyme
MPPNEKARRQSARTPEGRHVEAPHLLRRSGVDQRSGNACRTRPLQAGRNAATGEPGGTRARAGSILVVRQFLARRLPHGRCGSRDQELCRLYVSRSVLCEFCGNQRSIKAAKSGVAEDDVRDLINFESSQRYNERQKAALAYAEAIIWDLPTDDKFWARLHMHFSEPELVEIGYFIALTMGQQRWLRILDIDHHQVLSGESGSMAPGFETEEALKRAKADPNYWARKAPAAPVRTEAAE